MHTFLPVCRKRRCCHQKKMRYDDRYRHKFATEWPDAELIWDFAPLFFIFWRYYLFLSPLPWIHSFLPRRGLLRYQRRIVKRWSVSLKIWSYQLKWREAFLTFCVFICDFSLSRLPSKFFFFFLSAKSWDASFFWSFRNLMWYLKIVNKWRFGHE